MAEKRIATVAGKTMVKATFPGPSSYSSGGVQQRINSLRDVDSAFSLHMSGGYMAQMVPDGYSENQIKYKVFWQTGNSGEPMTEVADGTALTGETLEATVMGD